MRLENVTNEIKNTIWPFIMSSLIAWGIGPAHQSIRIPLSISTFYSVYINRCLSHLYFIPINENARNGHSHTKGIYAHQETATCKNKRNKHNTTQHNKSIPTYLNLLLDIIFPRFIHNGFFQFHRPTLEIIVKETSSAKGKVFRYERLAGAVCFCYGLNIQILWLQFANYYSHF